MECTVSVHNVYKLRPHFICGNIVIEKELLKNKEKLQKYIDQGIMNEDFTPNFNVNRYTYENSNYKTICGPFFPMRGLYYPGTGSEEYKVIAARMLEDRFPGEFGKAAQFRLNQTTIKRRLRISIRSFAKFINTTGSYCDIDSLYFKWLTQPHSKKKLRMAVNKKMASDVFCPLKSILYKGKDEELLAVGKKRGIADLGAYRTQLTGAVAEDIKNGMSVPYKAGNYEYHYVMSPQADLLSGVFRKLDNIEYNKCYMPQQGDDSAISAWCSDGKAMFNLDFSKCDNSHTDSTFDILLYMIKIAFGPTSPHYACISLAISYLREPITMRNKYNSKQKIKYEFAFARLYSGSIITTMINNVACFLLLMQLKMLVPNPGAVTKQQFQEHIIESARLIGFTLKCQVVNVLEEFQFLKHSCSFVNNVYVPWVNLGTYVKSFGMFDGDLPGKGSNTRFKAQKFISEVVVSRKNWGSHQFNRSFNHLIIEMKVSEIATDWKKYVDFDWGIEIPVDSLLARYKITEAEYDLACSHIARSTVYSIVYSDIINRIFQIDYG